MGLYNLEITTGVVRHIPVQFNSKTTIFCSLQRNAVTEMLLEAEWKRSGRKLTYI